jgi:hypothetical protein
MHITIQVWPKHIRLKCWDYWEHLGERIQNLMGTTNLPTAPPSTPPQPFNPKGENLNPLECMLSLLIGRMKIMVLKTVCHHFWPTQMDGMGSIGAYQCITVLSQRQGRKCRELTTILPEMGSFTLHKNLL